MKKPRLIHVLAALAAFAVLALAGAACSDDDGKDTGGDGGATAAPAVTSAAAEAIEIMDPFGRVTLDRGAAYFTIVNNGSEDDALVAASAPVAGRVELHETVTVGAETKMQPVDKIDVPAGEKVQLKPGGLHVMLMDLTRDLKEGDQYTLTLEFQSGLTREVEITVKSYSEDSGMGDGNGMDGGMEASPTGGM